MPREFSAGGVVIRRLRGQWMCAVITPHAKPNVRALPKGIIDDGEKPAKTAVREAWEETGLRSELLQKLGDVKYTYIRHYSDGARIFKVVSFFLLTWKSGRIGDITAAMRKEVDHAEWVPLEDAARTLSYKGEKQMAREAWRIMRAMEKGPA